jgi:hypothetical protein
MLVDKDEAVALRDVEGLAHGLVHSIGERGMIGGRFSTQERDANERHFQEPV